MANGDLVCGGVDAEVADLEFANRFEFVIGGNAAQVGAHTRQQFVHAEGLGDVVVGAGIEGFKLLPFLVAHGDNEDQESVRRREHRRQSSMPSTDGIERSVMMRLGAQSFMISSAISPLLAMRMS